MLDDPGVYVASKKLDVPKMGRMNPMIPGQKQRILREGALEIPLNPLRSLRFFCSLPFHITMVRIGCSTLDDGTPLSGDCRKTFFEFQSFRGITPMERGY